MNYLQMKLQKQKKNVRTIPQNVYKEIIFYNYFVTNIYMNINNVLYFIIVLISIYLFLYNVLRYNKVIEGASLNKDEIEMIYTQDTDINALKTKKKNIEDKIAEVEANIKSTNILLNSNTDKIQSNLKKSEEKLNETGIKK